MMCMNKVSSTIERASCPLTFKDILNYSSYFFSVFHFPVILLCIVLSPVIPSRIFFFFFFLLLFLVVVFTRELQKWEKMMMIMILSYCFWPLRGRYTRQLLSCPLVQISFLIFILDVFFFTPPPNKPSADGSTYIFHLIFKTHQMRR